MEYYNLFNSFYYAVDATNNRTIVVQRQIFESNPMNIKVFNYLTNIKLEFKKIDKAEFLLALSETQIEINKIVGL